MKDDMSAADCSRKGHGLHASELLSGHEVRDGRQVASNAALGSAMHHVVKDVYHGISIYVYIYIYVHGGMVFMPVLAFVAIS